MVGAYATESVPPCIGPAVDISSVIENLLLCDTSQKTCEEDGETVATETDGHFRNFFTPGFTPLKCWTQESTAYLEFI